jgi:hypothetical protein
MGVPSTVPVLQMEEAEQRTRFLILELLVLNKVLELRDVVPCRTDSADNIVDGEDAARVSGGRGAKRDGNRLKCLGSTGTHKVVPCGYSSILGARHLYDVSVVETISTGCGVSLCHGRSDYTAKGEGHVTHVVLLQLWPLGDKVHLVALS